MGHGSRAQWVNWVMGHSALGNNLRHTIPLRCFCGLDAVVCVSFTQLGPICLVHYQTASLCALNGRFLSTEFPVRSVCVSVCFFVRPLATTVNSRKKNG